MSVRIIGAVCVAAALAGCAKSSDEPPEISANAIASQGYDAYNRGYYSDAVRYFEDALAVAPDNAFAMQGLAASRDGVLYFGDRRPVHRASEVEQAIYRVSLLGYEAYERGDLDEADAQFRSVLDIAPGNRYALKGRAAVRRKAQKRKAAEEAAAATSYADITEARTTAVEPAPVLPYDTIVTEVYDAPVVDTYGLPVVEAYDAVVLEETYDAPVADASNDGAYVSVGSYDSYVASAEAVVPVYSGN